MQPGKKLTRITFCFLLINIANAFCSPNATGQMFAERTLGGAGTLQGNERFLRGNRSRRDFVGADRTDQQGFVGAQQALATGRVRSAVEDLQIETVNPRRINRPLTPIPTQGLYYPRLQIDSLASASEINPDLSTRVSVSNSLLKERMERIGGPNVEVSLLNETTAILQGSVESQRIAELLQQILLFEPGVNDVVNQLQVRKTF